MLDLRLAENRQTFAEFDGFGDKWKQHASEKYGDITPMWKIFSDLLHMRSNHAKEHEVHFTFAVEGNHRRLALSCVCLAAVATYNQGMLCVGSMINSELFHDTTGSLEENNNQLSSKLQALLRGEGEMTMDDDLQSHYLLVPMRYVVVKEVINVDVLKHFQERSKSISVSKKDSVEQAPFTNVGKLGFDFMMSISKEDIFKRRVCKILEMPMPINLVAKPNYYKDYKRNHEQPYSMTNLKEIFVITLSFFLMLLLIT